MTIGPLLNRKNSHRIYVCVCVLLKNIEKGLKTFKKYVLLKKCVLEGLPAYVLIFKHVDLR